MKIDKWVEFSKEIQVDISVEDITAAIDGETNSPAAAMRVLNRCAMAMKAITTEHIAGMRAGHLKTVEDFLRQQADRYVPTTPAEIVNP